MTGLGGARRAGPARSPRVPVRGREDRSAPDRDGGTNDENRAIDQDTPGSVSRTAGAAAPESRDVEDQVAEGHPAGDRAADGRSLRRSRNVQVVVDAMLALLAEGELWPSAADVAARAGLSERSVYRYFDDLDGMARVAVDTQMARAEHLFGPLPADGNLAERVDRLVTHRVAMFDEVGAVVHAARVRAGLLPAVGPSLARRRGQLRAQLAGLFAAELDRDDGGDGDDVLTALEVATGFDALHALRVDRSCSRPRTARILRRTVTALLTPG